MFTEIRLKESRRTRTLQTVPDLLVSRADVTWVWRAAYRKTNKLFKDISVSCIVLVVIVVSDYDMGTCPMEQTSQRSSSISESCEMDPWIGAVSAVLQTSYQTAVGSRGRANGVRNNNVQEIVQIETDFVLCLLSLLP